MEVKCNENRRYYRTYRRYKFYKRGRKAHFIRVSNRNSNNIEIVWFGEEHAYKEFGDVDEYPIKLFKKVYAE